MRLAMPQPCLRFELDRFEDQEIERALDEVDWFTHLHYFDGLQYAAEL